MSCDKTGRGLAWIVILGLIGAVGAQSYNLVCYYGSWARFRNGAGALTPADIDASLCTHLIYAFVDLNNDDVDDGGQGTQFSAFLQTKARNPQLKALVALGGWTAGVAQFQATARSTSRTQTFAQNAITFLRQWGFDGLDLDWEFPARADRGGVPRDRGDFTNFIRIIYQAFQNEVLQAGQERLLLTAAVFAYPNNENSYDLNQIGNYLDIVNIMSYDLEGSWNNIAGFNAPLGQVMNSVNSYISGGVPRGKIHMGLGAYGRTFRLSDTSRVTPGSPTSGAGDAGIYTQESGTLAYLEICHYIRTRGWSRAWWSNTKTPYAYSRNQYVGYDDLESFKYKIQNIMQEQLGGAMIWSIDLDDSSNLCQQGRFPLVSGAKQMLEGNFTMPSPSPSPPTQPTLSTAAPCGINFNYADFCARSDVPSGNYRDPADCHKFFACVNNVNFPSQSCQSGLAFNQLNNQCDFENQVPECQQDPCGNTTPSTTATTASTTVTTASTTTTTANPGSLSHFCDNKAEGLHPDPADCHNFIQCVSGVSAGFLFNCPAGTGFNGQRCDWESDIPQCLTVTETVTCPSSGIELIRDPVDCSVFYHCWMGHKATLHCPSGLLFHTAGYCTWPHAANC